MKSQLPESTDKTASPEWLLGAVAESSKNARNIFLLYVGFLTYCILTVVGTTDRQIILNETAHLPIVNIDVSLNGFFIISPIFAICLFIYFQIYLRKLNYLKSKLITNFPDIDKDRIYPWIVNFRDEVNPGILGFLQRLFIKISIWWSLPLALIIIALWYIKKHEPILSYLVGLMPLIGTMIVVLYWIKNYSNEISYEPPFPFKLIHQINAEKMTLILLVVAFEILFIWLLIPMALEGRGYKLTVDLGYEKLINEENKNYKTLYWVDLRNAHLEGAFLIGSILKKADLKDASLIRADLRNADLEKARLYDANLRKADLKGANLKGANLHNSNFESANLSSVKLDSANFSGANLLNAKLYNSDLRGAKNLTIEQLSQVETLFKAKLDTSLLDQLKKSYPDLLEQKR